MSFAQTFTDLRKRRRIPMRLFDEKVKIGPSYIYGVEKEGLLPSHEKLRLLASVFVDVAREQGAGRPEDDADRLFLERERTATKKAIGQLELEPDMSEALLAVHSLDTSRRADLLGLLVEAIGLFGTLEKQERSAVNRNVPPLIAYVESLDGVERREALASLGDVLEKALKSLQGNEGEEVPDLGELEASPSVPSPS